MPDFSSDLRAAAAGLKPHAGNTRELLQLAADRLDAADQEALWMYERIRALVRSLDKRARLEFG